MVRRYQQIHRLGSILDDIITQVAFSPSGTFVATASLDRKVCLWRVQGGELLYVWLGDSPVLCLIWLPGRDDAMLCGTQNGNLAVLTVTSVSTISPLYSLPTDQDIECSLSFRFLGTQISYRMPLHARQLASHGGTF